jgi:hypothetical protein
MSFSRRCIDALLGSATIERWPSPRGPISLRPLDDRPAAAGLECGADALQRQRLAVQAVEVSIQVAAQLGPEIGRDTAFGAPRRSNMPCGAECRADSTCDSSAALVLASLP